MKHSRIMFLLHITFALIAMQTTCSAYAEYIKFGDAPVIMGAPPEKVPGLAFYKQTEEAAGKSKAVVKIYRPVGENPTLGGGVVRLVEFRFTPTLDSVDAYANGVELAAIKAYFNMMMGKPLKDNVVPEAIIRKPVRLWEWRRGGLRVILTHRIEGDALGINITSIRK